MKKFDLTYYYDSELKACPKNRVDMAVFVKMEKEIVGSTDVKRLQEDESKLFVTRLGNLANFLKILHEYEEANHFYQLIEMLANKFNLGEKTKLVNKLRWADNHRYSGQFETAEKWFQECLEQSKKSKEFSKYHDFGLQHLGKVYFDQQYYAKALPLFAEALSLRSKKGDKELIESTSQALTATKNKFKKICVIGNSCSGKTTLSLQLEKLLFLPLHHVDSIQYLKGLQWRDPDETRAVLSDISNSSEWIIDGLGPLKILEDRMKKSDLIIVLRPVLPTIFFRLMIRQMKSLFKPRPELPADCFEATPRQTVRMIKTIWNVHYGLWKQLDRILQEEKYRKKVISFRSNLEIHTVVTALKDQ